MALSCSAKLLKYFVFVSNAVICVVGFFFLILSIRALANTGIIEHIPELADDPDLGNRTERAGLMMLAIFSGLIFVVGFMGCYGSYSESPAFLLAYSVVMFAFIVLIVASQILVVAGRNAFQHALENAMNQRYNTSEARQNFTHFEETFNCCGATPQLKPVFISEGLCEGKLAQQPDCCSVIATGADVGYLVLTFFLMIAAVIGLSASCSLRSAITERLSYTEF